MKLEIVKKQNAAAFATNPNKKYIPRIFNSVMKNILENEKQNKHIKAKCLLLGIKP